jgi:phospholipid transport system substrate-binding protein
MIARCTFPFSAVSILFVGLGANTAVWAQDTANRASVFIKGTGDKLVAESNSSDSDREKRRVFTVTMDDTIDVDGVARFCLGRFWRTATLEQQQRYTGLFHKVLVINVTANISEYRGVRFIMGPTQQRDDNIVVSTVVERPNHPPSNVDWIVRDSAGALKIIDIVAEGTSMRLTQRQDYASYLAHNDNKIEALLKALEQTVANAGE